ECNRKDRCIIHLPRVRHVHRARNIGFKARTFRDWVTHKYTKSHDRLANARKAATPRTSAGASRADAQKLHHARRVATAERRASVPTESRAACGGGGRSVGC